MLLKLEKQKAYGSTEETKKITFGDENSEVELDLLKKKLRIKTDTIELQPSKLMVLGGTEEDGKSMYFVNNLPNCPYTGGPHSTNILVKA